VGGATDRRAGPPLETSTSTRLAIPNQRAKSCLCEETMAVAPMSSIRPINVAPTLIR
jgi:hypothetical protein